MDDTPIKTETGHGPVDVEDTWLVEVTKESKRRDQEHFIKYSQVAAVKTKPAHDRLKMANETAENNAETIGLLDRELKEMEEEIVRLDKEKALVMSRKRTAEENKTRLVSITTDAQKRMELARREMDRHIAEQYEGMKATQPSIAGEYRFPGLRCPSMEEFTWLVADKRQKIPTIDLCTPESAVSRAGTPSQTPERSHSVPRRCNTCTPRPSTELPPPEESRLRRVSQLSLSFVGSDIFGPEQSPAESVSTKTEAHPAGTPSHTSKHNGNIASRNTNSAGPAERKPTPSSGIRDPTSGSSSLPTLRSLHRIEGSSSVQGHHHHTLDPNGYDASDPEESEPEESSGPAPAKRRCDGLRRSSTPPRRSVTSSPRDAHHHDSDSESEYDPGSEDSPPRATAAAPAPAPAPVSSVEFEHEENGTVSYLHEKPLRGIYHQAVKKSAVMRQIFSKPFIRPVQVRNDGLGLKRDHRGNLIFNWQPHANCEAVLAQSRGELAPVPCQRCKEGFGRFFGCMVMPGMFKGSCANCRWAANDCRCSFRPTVA